MSVYFIHAEVLSGGKVVARGALLLHLPALMMLLICLWVVKRWRNIRVADVTL